MSRQENGLIAKWGNELFDDGITNAPQCFMRYGRRFVKSTHFQLICCIISYQYGSDAPFPAQQTIADNMGISLRRVKQLLSEIEEEGHAEVVWRFNKNGTQSSNEYNFAPLLEKCLKYSQSLRKQKEEAEGIKRVPKPKKDGGEESVHPSNYGGEESVHPPQEESVHSPQEESVHPQGEQSVATKKGTEERNINKDLEESVCTEEQQIIALLESRPDIDNHTHTQIMALLKSVKNKSSFTYEIFLQTLDLMDFDIDDIKYFKAAIKGNLNKGYVFPANQSTRSTGKEVLPEWFNKATDNSPFITAGSEQTQEEKKLDIEDMLKKLRN